MILPRERKARSIDIATWPDCARSGHDRPLLHLTDREFVLRSGYSIAKIAIFGYGRDAGDAGIDYMDYPQITRWDECVLLTPDLQPHKALGQFAAYPA